MAGLHQFLAKKAIKKSLQALFDCFQAIFKRWTSREELQDQSQ